MNTAIDIFFSLLKRSVGVKITLPPKIDNKTWFMIYELAKQQTVLGIVFLAIKSLDKEQRPPKTLLLKWWACVEFIKRQNLHTYYAIKNIEKRFADDGFRGTVLKGAGVGSLYPHPLYRTSGDIDFWLDSNRKKIINYVKCFNESPTIIYHHVDFKKIDSIPVEIHFTPSHFNNLYINSIFQKWVIKERQKQMEYTVQISEEGFIHTPTVSFNRIYILLHIYRHLFDEGVGLRQLMDYYYVLCQGFTETERQETIALLKRFKMERFTGAVMWVLHEVFGLENRYMLTKPNEREGKFLLEEIMIAGNMGHYDPRIIRSKDETLFTRFIRRTIRNFRFLHSYPSEVIWSPIFKIWQRFWMLRWN